MHSLASSTYGWFLLWLPHSSGCQPSSRHNDLSALRVNLPWQIHHIKECYTDFSLMKPFSNTGFWFLISCCSIWLRGSSHASGSSWYKSWICRDKIKARTRHPHLTHWFPHCCCSVNEKMHPLSLPLSYLLISSCPPPMRLNSLQSKCFGFSYRLNK